jgi:hypothetical protein
MQVKLKKDIVIKAGTIFYTAPTKVERYDDSHFEHTIGLTDDTSGSLTYYVDKDDPKIKEWFETIDG